MKQPKIFQNIIGYKTPLISLAEAHWLIEEVRSIQPNNYNDYFPREGKHKYFFDFEAEWATVKNIIKGVAGIKASLKENFIQKNRKQSLWPKVNGKLCKKLGGDGQSEILSILMRHSTLL